MDLKWSDAIASITLNMRKSTLSADLRMISPSASKGAGELVGIGGGIGDVTAFELCWGVSTVVIFVKDESYFEVIRCIEKFDEGR